MQTCGRKAERGKKGADEVAARCAEEPGQALNVDVCFVPEQHEGQEKLPAVSGSSGRLVVGRLQDADAERAWPGQVFAEAELDYVAAMNQYAHATRERLVHAQTRQLPVEMAPSPGQLATERQVERYRVRQQRKQEDAAWKAAKAQHRQAVNEHRRLSRRERKQQQALWGAQDQAWRQLRAQRQHLLQQRQQEDETWHQRNRASQAALTGKTQTRAWIAILVVTDNCSRQCLGLPLFRTGARLTSQEVVTALRALLPKELLFVISDQGTHFRSTAFAQFALEAGFIHVPVYRHRPQSNGIAERFVQTLKDCLCPKTWQSVEELQTNLAAFISYYNDRPHQGLAIPGLSPNEFANRIWLM